MHVVKSFLPIQIVTIIEGKTSKAAEQSFKLSNWIQEIPIIFQYVEGGK